MQATPHLALPYIMPAQAQKHVTHNEALDTIDALAQLAVVTRGLSEPPEAPGEGARYLVAPGASGAWDGHDDALAVWRDGGWRLFAPQPGWLAVVLDEGTLLVWTGSEWASAVPAPALLENLEGLGVGTAPDSENPFAAKLNKALWTALTTGEGGTGDLRYTLNKQGAEHVLSLLMQSNWSGRAEIGLAGNDELAIRVSPDGADWIDAVRIDHESGRAMFPASNYLESFAVSLLADSGRFAGNSAAGVTVGGFAWPSYMSLQNDASVAGAGKFITNNTDYGGTAGTLSATAKDLVDMIRSPANRRYGLEFHIAEITMGAGTSYTPVTIGGVTHYFCLHLTFGARPPSMSFHCYIRAVDAPIVWRLRPGQSAIRHGAVETASFVIDPSEGWVSVTILDQQNPFTSDGYNPTPLSIYAASEGDRFHLACPALMGGITRVDPNTGVIAGVNRWLV